MDTGCNLDLSHLPKELKLLLEIIKKEDKDLQTIQKDWFIDIDWNKFLKLTLHHRMYPLIYTKMKDIDKQLVPSHVVQALSAYSKRNTFHMLHLSGEMGKVSKLFAENQLRLLFLKGPILGVDLYGDISLRTSGDLDVLVPMDDLGKVNELLVKNGYIKEDDFPTVMNEWKWRRHHTTYMHPMSKVKLEIHWRLHPGPGKEPRFDELWKRKRTSPITSYPVYFLGREDLFMFLVCHGTRHGWSRIRWLADIDRIVRQEMDWKELNFLLKKYQCNHLVGQALVLSSQLLNTPATEETKVFMSGERFTQLAQIAIYYLESMINLHTDPVPEEVSKYHERYLYSLKTSSQKLLFHLSWLYPYPQDVETLPLPKQLHVLYFPLRPILWMWRKMMGHKEM
ncbi:nucleotidyltransferase family protein [Bacillus sp. DX4.1]|uniref:nucleotidyltransferase domain-containing protein n=1 Tax=Bacillus sp. DX4.1 TaxID=3055867 RepID=UPI0025A21F1B|nr:nucleotidyltransferase family protein [Bacillus sp. DX4.1]MDM5190844.1 nucleotidyltransferase family protein [Bacillus sp. DX4.1]